jgi:hypothetical protein
VYYTAVEVYHSGSSSTVDGRRYPRGFVDTVQAEGTGRTRTSAYLNWSYDTGFWHDDAPRDAYGNALRPFESAAADPSVLAAGTRFAIVDCGREPDGTPVDPAVSARLREARWTVTDQFTPGFGGPRHLDLYLGEETGPRFTQSPWYCTLSGATIRIGPGVGG